MRMLITKPEHCDVRYTKRFLWFPKIVEGELRWLERAEMRQVYDENYKRWETTHWITK